MARYKVIFVDVSKSVFWSYLR